MKFTDSFQWKCRGLNQQHTVVDFTGNRDPKMEKAGVVYLFIYHIQFKLMCGM